MATSWHLMFILCSIHFTFCIIENSSIYTLFIWSFIILCFIFLENVTLYPIMFTFLFFTACKTASKHYLWFSHSNRMMRNQNHCNFIFPILLLYILLEIFAVLNNSNENCFFAFPCLFFNCISYKSHLMYYLICCYPRFSRLLVSWNGDLNKGDNVINEKATFHPIEISIVLFIIWCNMSTCVDIKQIKSDYIKRSLVQVQSNWTPCLIFTFIILCLKENDYL